MEADSTWQSLLGIFICVAYALAVTAFFIYVGEHWDDDRRGK